MKNCHKSMEPFEYYETLFSELHTAFKIDDPRLEILIIHLYAEYWINEIIKKIFRHPDVILDANIDFYKKYTIIKAYGVIQDKRVLENIETLNSIRNHYAHTLDYDRVLESSVVHDKIKKMSLLTSENSHNLESDNPLEYLRNCSISTLYELSKIPRKITHDKMNLEKIYFNAKIVPTDTNQSPLKK